MRIATNIGLRDYMHRGLIWHGDFDLQFGKGATLLIGHGITRSMIGHPVPENAAVGVARLDVTGDSEDLSGVILFLS
jgi:hypothetical protein